MPYYFEHLNQLRKEGVLLWITPDWVQTSLETILNFAEQCPAFVREQLEELFGCKAGE